MLSLAQIEALAPDQASLAAAAKLLKPALWPLLARDAAGGLVWGEAQGSGSAPYRLAFDPADRGYTCSCPSRKFPCKHVLALMWQYAAHSERFTAAEAPPWVAEWLSRRRPGPPRQAPSTPGRASIAALLQPAAEADADAEPADAKVAQRRARADAAREAAVDQGMEALDVWIADQLDAGLAGFVQRATSACRAVAQRLVDAKAGTLAARVDALPATLLGLPEALRPDFVLAELGRLHLLAAAWRRRDRLDEPLRQDLRRTIGWTARREAALADPLAERRTGEWIVAGVRDMVQPDRIRRTETWLCAADPAASGPRQAVLLDFTPVSAGAAGEAMPPGERFAAELVFHPSSVPLRALVARREAATALDVPPPAGPPLPEAFAAHQARVAALPWLGDDLLVAGGARVVEAVGGLWLVDAEGTVGLRLAAEQAKPARPLLGLDLHGLAGVWDGRVLTLLSAATPLGPWFAPA